MIKATMNLDAKVTSEKGVQLAKIPIDDSSLSEQIKLWNHARYVLRGVLGFVEA